MTMSRVDELRPHEQANGEEREVLDVVDSLVPEGVVIGGGNVPGADHERPDSEAYRRTQQERESAAKQAPVSEQTQDRSG